MATTKSTHQNAWKTDPFEHDQGHSSGGILDSLLGTAKEETDKSFTNSFEEKSFRPGPVNQEVFAFKDYRETKLIPQEIEQIKQEIDREVKRLKAINSSMAQELDNIQNETIKSVSEKSGIYHLRFLETLLSMLKLLVVKASEGASWLTAINTKKAKRGSLYKKQTKSGSKDSVTHLLSQEKSAARVQ